MRLTLRPEENSIAKGPDFDLWCEEHGIKAHELFLLEVDTRAMTAVAHRYVTELRTEQGQTWVAVIANKHGQPLLQPMHGFRLSRLPPGVEKLIPELARRPS